MGTATIDAMNAVILDTGLRRCDEAFFNGLLERAHYWQGPGSPAAEKKVKCSIKRPILRLVSHGRLHGRPLQGHT
jgi:hypothetical protein